MNLPIPTSAMLSSAVIGGATRIASNLVNRVGEAVGFDKVLQEAFVGDHAGSGEQPHDLKKQTLELIQGIRQRLLRIGIAANQPLSLSVTESGNLRVEGQHRRGAEIEFLLNSDQGLVGEAKRLHRAAGSPDTAIGLTIPGDLAAPSDLTLGGSPGNILQSPGGYPNW